MSDITIKALIETIKDLPEDDKETILYLTQIFKGEENIIIDYVKNELNR
ncbi:hypothetical protein [Clostridium gelidum]|nr:hypothetical protein [Clostridium gelidum]